MNPTGSARMKTWFHAIIFRQQETKLLETGASFPGMKKTKCKMLQHVSSYEASAASTASTHFAFYTMRTKALRQ
jgi:hypothetical protein